MTNLIVLTKGTKLRFDIMEYKNFSSKFTNKKKANQNTDLLTRTFTMRYVFSVINQKIYFTKVSYCQNLDIREVSIALV